MTWFKVDDGLAFHSKTIAAGNAAMGVWVRAGSWSSQQLTDGHIPTQVAKQLGRPSEIRRLVDAGLWEQIDDGYLFHQYHERNPTRAEVEHSRESNRRRGDLHRDKETREAVRERDQGRCRYCGILLDFKARRGPHRGTYDHVNPKVGNLVSNLVLACGPCNSSKGHRTPEQARMPLLPEGSLGKGLENP